MRIPPQVEVNRSLYMVEESRGKLPESFARLREDLAYVASEIAQGIRDGSFDNSKE